VLGKAAVSASDQQVGLSTAQLQKPGVYQLQALYLPGTSRFAESRSAPVTVTITPLSASSFRVRPVARFGARNDPMSFQVTALDAQGQPLTDYTGTVVFTSPTDSLPNLPASVYTRLGIGEPSPATPGLASFALPSYTFTPADHGSHMFVDAVRFGKPGAESIQVTQANDPKVTGKATFSIE
jgi:hypothetical protein